MRNDYIPPEKCPYNAAVVCGNDSKCGSCGWNPVVEKARKEALLTGKEGAGIGNN